MKIYKKVAVLGAFVFGLNACVSAQKPAYDANWESLKKHETPDWFRDAKFGIYFHWGPYSVPAYQNEWYSHNMYIKGSKANLYHEKTYGSLDKFGYKDFIPLFKAEKFDANEWVSLFETAGAKFSGPIAEHADGFAMWDSKLTEWDAKDMGPKRDIVGEMKKAISKTNMKFLLTYHRHWMYAWYPTWDKTTDASNPEFAGLYGPKVPERTFVMANKPTSPLPGADFNKEWLDRLTELVDNYSPDLVWFDNKMDIIDERKRLEFLSSFYNKAAKQNKEVVCTYKFEDMAVGSAVLDLERARMSEGKEFPWLTDDSIDWHTWSYTNTPNFKSTNRLIDFLVDVVSKNGNVLLNVTPKADGSIPDEVRERLTEMGAWLKINGEAIYGTRPWHIYGEGETKVVEGHLSEEKNKDNVAEDIRFTTKGNALYAISLDVPKGQLLIKSLANGDAKMKTISKVSLLGYSGKVKWERTEKGLEIHFPADFSGQHAVAFKIE